MNVVADRGYICTRIWEQKVGMIFWEGSQSCSQRVIILLPQSSCCCCCCCSFGHDRIVVVRRQVNDKEEEWEEVALFGHLEEAGSK